MPVVAVPRRPAGTGQPQQRQAGLRTRVDRVRADRLGERVRGVDDRTDALGPGVSSQAVRAAEAAHPDLAGGQGRVADPAGQRADDPQARHVG